MSKKTIKKPLSGFLKNFRMLKDMYNGGLEVNSWREGDDSPYAKTLMQLDGDVCTFIPKDFLRDDHSRDLMEQHYTEVSQQLKPIAQLSRSLNAFRVVFLTIGAVAVGYDVYRCDISPFMVIGIVIFAIGFCGKPLFRLIVKRKSKKL